MSRWGSGYFKTLRKTGFQWEEHKPMSHKCHWPTCNTEVHPKMWGCKPHWWLLPSHIRNEILKYYRPGQEEDKKPSASYIVAAQQAHSWALGYIRKHPPPPTILGD